MVATNLKRRRALQFVAALGLPAVAAADPAVRIVTSHLPPLAVQDSPSMPGALYEIVTELMRRAKVEGTIDYVPWRRGLFLVDQMPRTAMFPLTRSAEREGKFRWLAKLYRENFIFLAKKGRFKLDRPAELKESRITALRGSTTINMLRDKGYQRIVEATSINECLRFVAGGMADAVFANESILLQSIKGRPDEAEFESSKAVDTAVTWLAGSRDFSEAEASRLQGIAEQMAAEGVTAKILRKYDLRP